MYVSFTQYDGATFIYDTNLSIGDIEHLWNLTRNMNPIEKRLKAIEDFSKAAYQRFEKVKAESQFFT